MRLFYQKSIYLSIYLSSPNPNPNAHQVRTFDSSWVHTIGRGNGADGYSFVFGDLREVAAPFGEMGVGDGLAVRFRTHAYFTDKSGCADESCEQWNQGYGLLQLVRVRVRVRVRAKVGLGLA